MDITGQPASLWRQDNLARERSKALRGFYPIRFTSIS
jgi:hypothetical protein